MPTLTKRVIDLTPCPSFGQQFLRDSELKGFAVRLTPGAKTFVVEKRLNGRLHRVTIGAYGAFTLHQAREQARSLLFDLYLGRDPLEAKRQQRQELSLGELWSLYTERRQRLKSLRKYQRRYRYHLAAWDRKKLSVITRAEIAKLHASIGAEAPYEANRVLSLLHTLFNSAKQWGLYDKDNPVTGIERYREEKRERFLQPTELQTFFEALQNESIYTQTAFRMMLLTGARMMEVLSMRWSDVDLDTMIWTIPHTKNNRTHRIPLPQALTELLSTLPRLLGCPYVFPGRDGRKHQVNIVHAWQRILKRMGKNDLRIHDLRRTLGSWLAADGQSLILIGKALNHTSPQSTGIYARLALDPVRNALETNAQRMLSVETSKELV